MTNKMTNKTSIFKTIGSVFIIGVFLFLASGSGGSKDENEDIKIESLNVNGNSATFTHNVGFMYTSEQISIAKEVWGILNKYPEVNNISIKIVEECEDKFGNKHETISNIVLDSNWISTNNVRSFVNADKFGEYAWQSNPFESYWTAKGNYCD